LATKGRRRRALWGQAYNHPIRSGDDQGENT
jgi:hypothetical protein